jgi:hypothetical protein
MAGFNQKWQSIPATDILKFFLCDPQTGLSAQEAALRINKLGNNNIPFFSFSSWNMLNTAVIRDGRKTSTKNSMLALGDMVILEKNKIIPADIRLIEVDNLSVNQAVLTGTESIVYKNANTNYAPPDSPFNIKNMAYAGSLVVNGQATGIVVATGSETLIANTKLYLPKQTRKIKNFQKKLNKHEMIINKITDINYLKRVDTVIINFSAPPDAIKEFIRIFSHQMGKNLIICTDELSAKRLIAITPGMTHINKKYFKEKSNKALMEADYPLMSFVNVDGADILRFSKLLNIKNRTAICLDAGKNSLLAMSDLLTIVPADIAIDEAIIKSNFLVNSFIDTKKIIDQTKIIIS